MKLRIEPPLYMIGRKTTCWRCQARMPVIALLAPRVADAGNQVCVLGQIEKLPEDILAFVQQKVPTFRFRTSRMGGTRYFANTCPKCRVIFGHFFLHAEPGAPFFPTSEEEARSLYMKEIPLSGSVEVDASPSLGTGELIMENARKI
jgi:hypothetical protein